MKRLAFPKPKREAKEPKRPVRKTRPRKQRKGTPASLKRKCDKLWSLIVRHGGGCELAGKDHVRCGGVLQAMHNFGRGHAGVRHELWNGTRGCAGHHVWYTHHPEAWTAVLVGLWGSGVYQSRYEEAKAVAKPDYARTLESLQIKARELGITA